MYRYTPILVDINFIDNKEDKYVKVNASDHTAGYLIDKIGIQNNSIDIDTNDDNSKLMFSVNIVDCGHW